MTQETGAKLTAEDAAQRVNQLLHELEAMVNIEQHEALTELFAEWSVLSAMKTTLEMQKATTEVMPPFIETSTETEKGA